jgi:hypothetical protein
MGGDMSLDDSNAAPQSDADKPASRRSRVTYLISGAAAGLVATMVGLLALAVLAPGVDLRNTVALSPVSSSRDAGLPKQTEQIFLNTVKTQPEEWSNARADHRLVAYAVFNCKKLAGVAIDAMPRRIFSALLLDLTPTGHHVFDAKDGEEALMAARDKDIRFELTDTDHYLLSLSDSIARARLLAAGVASSNAPDVFQLGLITLFITALATLFVTLQGRMKPVELNPEEKEKIERGPFFERVRNTFVGPGAGFRWVAFFAISLSITGTSLTGLKQIYDPTRTLAQNTRALLELRQLHQKVSHGITCNAPSQDRQVRMAEWSEAVVRIRGSMMPGYGAYTNLDVGTNGRRLEGGDPPAPLQRQPEVDPTTRAALQPAAKGAERPAEPEVTPR